MTNEQQMVLEFMRTFGQTCPEGPCIPSLSVRILRAKLIFEEALELITHGLCVGIEIKSRPDGDWINIGELEIEDIEFNQYGHGDLTLIADGCSDLKVVTIGTEVACGIDGKEIFEEVHRSNMSKMWTLPEYKSANRLVDFSVTNVSSMNEDEMINSDRCFLVKNKDGKVIKSPSYSPANIKSIIERQQARLVSIRETLAYSNWPAL